MTQNTPGLTDAELKALREQLPLLQKIVGILSAPNVTVDSGLTVDDRTAALDLPLPHSSNRLETDVPRLREAFKAVDAFAGQVTKVTEIKADKADLLAEIDARTQSDAALERAMRRDLEKIGQVLEKTTDKAREALAGLDEIELSWEGILGKPEVFPPDEHGHAVADIAGVLPIANGGTGAQDAAQARANLGIAVPGSGFAPLPQVAAGVGQFIKIQLKWVTGGLKYTLPAGGTWVAIIYETGGTNSSYVVTSGANIGIFPGGTVLNVHHGTNGMLGYVWRVS